MLSQHELIAGLPAFKASHDAEWLAFLKASQKANLQRQDVVTYAWRLGCLVQAELEAKAAFGDVIAACIEDADVSGLVLSSLSGLDAAIGILAAYWVHGEELLQWHRYRCSLN